MMTMDRDADQHYRAGDTILRGALTSGGVVPKHLVTVAIPVYERLEYLPQAIESVRRQDYPHVELIVSSNGRNPEVPDLVERYYGKAFRFRQNLVAVPMAAHFNQLVDAASGEYFLLLSDDDEISSNCLSTLVGLLDRDPGATLALCRVEAMDKSGDTTASSDEMPLAPPVMTGPGFVRAWCLYTHKFICLGTNLSRTTDVRALGGYPAFASGHGIDNALVVKLCLTGRVLFTAACTFRFRIHDASYSQSASCATWARGSREFLSFLDTDPHLLRFANAHPETWAETKALLIRMTYRNYLARWMRVYRRSMSPWAWVKAAFALPGIPRSYARALMPRANKVRPT
jgi:glycosyltransferase involved in cell wall biosynthesis